MAETFEPVVYGSGRLTKTSLMFIDHCSGLLSFAKFGHLVSLRRFCMKLMLWFSIEPDTEYTPRSKISEQDLMQR